MSSGGISGSRASTEPSGLGPSGFDPGRKFTPGPWEYDPDDETIISSVSATIVADIPVADDFPCLDDEDRPAVQAECVANACLIAAAPDLYAALAELDELRAGCSPDELGAICGKQVSAFIGRYREALAKARGEHDPR